jgi:hypothetical protein
MEPLPGLVHRMGDARVMADVLFVAVVVGFFALCALYVKGCERILGGAEEAGEADGGTAAATRQEVAR